MLLLVPSVVGWRNLARAALDPFLPDDLSLCPETGKPSLLGGWSFAVALPDDRVRPAVLDAYCIKTTHP